MTFEYQQNQAQAGYFDEQYSKQKEREAKANLEFSSAAPISGEKQITVVFFIGGVTFAEISALRHLSQRPNHDRSYIIFTTKLINGSTLIDSLEEDLQNNLDPRTVRV